MKPGALSELDVDKRTPAKYHISSYFSLLPTIKVLDFRIFYILWVLFLHLISEVC